MPIETTAPISITPSGSGVVLRAEGRPAVWLGEGSDTCGPSALDRQLLLPRPKGWFAAESPPSPLPWGALSWEPVCIEGDAGAVLAYIVYFEPTRDPGSDAHVRSILSSIATAVRPPLEVAPGILLDRTELEGFVRPGPAANEVEYDGTRVAIRLDAQSCAALPVGGNSVCVELLDRAATVTWEELERQPVDPALAPLIAELEPSRPAPSPVPRSSPPPALAHALLDAARASYHPAVFAPSTFNPQWANGQLALARLPTGNWKLSDRGQVFELYDVMSGARITVSRASCGIYWSTPHPGPQIPSARFLPGGPAAYVTDGPSWSANSCTSVLGADVEVTLALPSAPDASTELAYAQALTEIVSSQRMVYAAALAGMRGSYGMTSDLWIAGRWSGLTQIDFLYAGDDGEGQVHMFRLAFAGGVGVSRPNVRAGLHAGFGFETAPMREVAGEDHTGGSLFVDARSMASLGGWIVHANVRGTWYFDMDCNNAPNDEDDGSGVDVGCDGESDHSDFTPHLGLETELRLGAGTKRGGWRYGAYLGVRYIAITTGDRVEHNAIASLGYIYW